MEVHQSGLQCFGLLFKDGVILNQHIGVGNGPAHRVDDDARLWPQGFLQKGLHAGFRPVNVWAREFVHFCYFGLALGVVVGGNDDFTIFALNGTQGDITRQPSQVCDKLQPVRRGDVLEDICHV